MEHPTLRKTELPMRDDGTSTDLESLYEENNKLFFAIVQCWEYLTGNPNRTYDQLVSFLERALEEYGVRDERPDGPVYKYGKLQGMVARARRLDRRVSPKETLEIAQAARAPKKSDGKLLDEIMDLYETSPNHFRTAKDIAVQLVSRGYKFRSKDHPKSIVGAINKNASLFDSIEVVISGRLVKVYRPKDGVIS